MQSTALREDEAAEQPDEKSGKTTGRPKNCWQNKDREDRQIMQEVQVKEAARREGRVFLGLITEPNLHLLERDSGDCRRRRARFDDGGCVSAGIT